MDKHVKGTLFEEYVKMIKRNRHIDWRKYLIPSDKEYLKKLILPSQWYPYDVYQRFGAAIFHEIADSEPEVARSWGRYTMENLAELYNRNLIHEGDPIKSLGKFKSINSNFFDFEGFEVNVINRNKVEIKINPAFGTLGIVGYSYQMLGSFQKLVELSGQKDVKAEFAKRFWEGDPYTVISINWSEQK